MATDPVATAASDNPLLKTLVAAVGAAGLGDTLNSAPAITVFAPVDSAFAKIPKADLDKVLADKADPDQDPHRSRRRRQARPRPILRATTRRSRQHSRLRARARSSPSARATPTSSAATCRPPTPRSTSSTASSCPDRSPPITARHERQSRMRSMADLHAAPSGEGSPGGPQRPTVSRTCSDRPRGGTRPPSPSSTTRPRRGPSGWRSGSCATRPRPRRSPRRRSSRSGARRAGSTPTAGSAVSWILTIVHRKAVDRVRSAEASRGATRRTTPRTRPWSTTPPPRPRRPRWRHDGSVRRWTHDRGPERGSGARVLQGVHPHGGGSDARPPGGHGQDTDSRRTDPPQGHDGSGTVTESLHALSGAYVVDASTTTSGRRSSGTCRPAWTARPRSRACARPRPDVRTRPPVAAPPRCAPRCSPGSPPSVPCRRSPEAAERAGARPLGRGGPPAPPPVSVGAAGCSGRGRRRRRRRRPRHPPVDRRNLPGSASECRRPGDRRLRRAAPSSSPSRTAPAPPSSAPPARAGRAVLSPSGMAQPPLRRSTSCGCQAHRPDGAGRACMTAGRRQQGPC